MEFRKLQEIIARVLNLGLEEIGENARFVEDLGADSLELFQIFMEVEKEFELEISVQDTASVRTVKEAYRLLLES